uniref:Reverse transcriptase Ty1/copia-type domain-containing protein n=1 Tax=Tanacetum cinerariifolium TaxID=118510 RepID=A0A699GH48_TANCI|nr:hypothetical protein [Tanacetum cinerariifolium]
MTRMVKEQGGLTQINNDNFHTCMFAGFLSQEEPKRVHQALKDPSWIEAMQEELLQFKMQKGKVDQTLFIKKQKGDILLVHVYVDGIIFVSTNKDLCKAFEKLMKNKFQMSSMGELTFFLGLQVKQKQDGIFISLDKYVAKILRKFGLTDGKLASTPIDTEKPLLKDPNDMFDVCASARFQVTSKASHLHAVKRIFSDYAGASLDRKSITGVCQFLSCILIYWQCKKQTVVATSSTEAEYVAACKDKIVGVKLNIVGYYC